MNDSLETAKDAAQEKIDEIKSKVELKKLLKKVVDKFRAGEKKEAVKSAAVFLVAILAKDLFELKKKVEKTKTEKEGETDETETAEEEENEEEEEENERRSPRAIDPCLVGEASEGMEAVCRKNISIEEVAKDHRHNAKMLELSPGKRAKLDEVVRFYKAHKERYDKVSKATGIPGMLICAIHYRENMDFNSYLHNGEPLGQVTTIVPAGILFRKGQWEEAAIHALGGNIKDVNGKKSLKKFQTLRKKLRLTADSKDIGAMMAFAEAYNGMGYRRRGVRSAYVYAGTSLQERGHYYADSKFGKNLVDRRLGTAAIIMGIQSDESGESLRVAGEDHLKTSRRSKGSSERASSAAENIPPSVLASITEACPRAEVQSGLVPLRTEVMKNRKGKRSWKKDTTDNWDYEGAGNSEKKMARGIYSIEAVLAPAGYTRAVSGVPEESRPALSKIAVALLKNKQMPLFTGIAIEVDGIEVMMVKEIHMNARYPLPHSGVSYIVKKS